ncbi:MAG: ECF transporter S component [Clostridiales bacterium]|nr:MAG: ECF transporter S component [Clostridiales bacterium]
MQQKRKNLIRKMVIAALFGAIGFILMVLEFAIPIIPSFIKLDFSELPALLASFSIGPWWGILVCLIKNLMHLFLSSTMGIGELSNFIIGSVFVFTAGMFYKHRKTRGMAFWGSLTGAVAMSVISVFSNYYIVYPIYAKLFMPMEAILGMYKAILPSVTDLWSALLIFNLPFTFIKGMISVAITFICYKYLSPLIKGEKRTKR